MNEEELEELVQELADEINAAADALVLGDTMPKGVVYEVLIPKS
jgi:hypothetical protein